MKEKLTKFWIALKTGDLRAWMGAIGILWAPAFIYSFLANTFDLFPAVYWYTDIPLLFNIPLFIGMAILVLGGGALMLIAIYNWIKSLFK